MALNSLSTTVTTSWWDNKHVVFGEVADEDSTRVVKAIEACGKKENGKPKYTTWPTIEAAG